MSRVLIANRGEIAVRIQRAATTLGLGTVAVFAPADRDARHVQLADDSFLLDGPAGYMDADALIAVARRTGCTLLHPGYGFLSENADFAARCVKADLTFVGPSPDVLALLGDKAAARALATDREIPVLPATDGGTSLEEAQEFLAGLGPGAEVMVKAVAGGGGRGMRVVDDPAQLAWAFERAASEAMRAFGHDELYVEQLLPRAKHVEVQVLGDGTGEVAHAWDRECSVQRRHQKLIEIAPCVTLDEAQRRPLLDAATDLVAAVNYRGLATVEFLVDAGQPDRFFFLEINPRVQVEHTVTEQVTGLDLVAIQLQLAGGATLAELGATQPHMAAPRGAAVQVRVNAEQVRSDGTATATAGTLHRFDVPGGPGIRVDTDGYAGRTINTDYDPLLAKVVAHAPRPDLAAAAARADAALAEFGVDGVGTNLPLLRAVLANPQFRGGAFTTTFVDDHLDQLTADMPEDEAAPEDTSALYAPYASTVVTVPVAPGEHVATGTALLVLEAMKMEQVVSAPVSGIVDQIFVTAGDTVAQGTLLARLTPDADQAKNLATSADVDLDHIRDDLAEVQQRHHVTRDEARPDAVARRRASGQRTARENIADLCDTGTFTEYGALTIAAQRQRRSLGDLIANTPADGMVTGIGHVNGQQAGPDRSRCVVMSYDYTVLAGTQGLLNHKKTDRMLDLAHRQRVPVVLFAEGGGGRPGDTDTTAASALDVATFTTMGRLSGQVPTVGIASGRCFAGNAALLGCCDLIIATRDATIGMGGPAMIEGGGLGRFAPEEVGPTSVQVPNGVVDVLVKDEAEAVATAKRYLSYLQTSRLRPSADGEAAWTCADQRRLRHVVPENRVRAYDVREAVELLADTGSMLELRPEFGVGILTSLVRIEGRAMGLVANNPQHLGGAIDGPAADKLARFLQLCDAHGLPVLSLCDTPGFMVGPDAEKTATVRRFSRLFVIGAHLSVPLVGVVLRKGYGLGAQSMVGGGFRSPVATLAWPTGEVGGMGLEGAVRLGYRRELDAVEDPQERRGLFEKLLAEQYATGKALHAAAVFELDDVIDPADTRSRVTAALPDDPDPRPPRRYIDT